MRNGLAMLAALAGATATGPAAAMVPTHYQHLNELRAVLNLRALADTLREPIDRIERVPPNVWRVTAGRCYIDVRMAVIPSANPGLSPPRTEPRPGRRTCPR